MARPGRPERNKTARSFRQLRRFHHGINSNKVFGTHRGFIVAVGGGKGILTFRHRNYPFTVQGLSPGLTAGASINKLFGRADYITELSDFARTHSAVAAGGALAGGPCRRTCWSTQSLSKMAVS
jgi:hypothetical protein